MADENQHTKRRLQISQETITMVTVGVALAGLMLVISTNMHEDARTDRTAWQAEARQLRDEARADRTAWQDESQKLRDDFQREILRLTRDHAELAASLASSQPKKH